MSLDPVMILLWGIPIVFAITLHECAHGYVANIKGDPTAKMLGRLTINPIKHIDPIGTIVVPLVLATLGGIVFGWAKPVPVNPRNLRKPTDIAWVAIAGPMSNLAMAIFWGGCAKLATTLQYPLSTNLFTMSMFGIWINTILMILNLLPIPPLDGSQVVSSLLPKKIAYHYDKLNPYGMFILLGLVFMGILGHLLLPPAILTVTAIKELFHIPVFGLS